MPTDYTYSKSVVDGHINSVYYFKKATFVGHFHPLKSDQV